MQQLVPKGTWQGSLLNSGGEYALMGTTVSPGFEYSDYEPGVRETLISMFPKYRELIQKLT